MLAHQFIELAEKYRTKLQKQIEIRFEEMQQDDNSHFLFIEF
ncbi:MAG: ApaLI family restriction endonuclease [Thiotrichaceae bacterium]